MFRIFGSQQVRSAPAARRVRRAPLHLEQLPARDLPSVSTPAHHAAHTAGHHHAHHSSHGHPASTPVNNSTTAATTPAATTPATPTAPVSPTGPIASGLSKVPGVLMYPL
jgi:hypothetical protein